ncbi:hypothetical protein BKA93DRAFT_731639 [Sparassis latifolia]
MLALKQRLQQAPRPLARHLGISIATCVLFFISFLLFFLVALSLPIIKTIYLFSLKLDTAPGVPASSVATDLMFGVWGLCASSVLEGFEVCYGPKLGYTVPTEILNLTGYPSLVEGVIEGLTVLLVLHPVCAGLAFVVMFTSLFLESHALCITSLVVSIFTIVLATAVFAADLALVLIARIKIPALTQYSYYVNWGPAVWMVLAALVVLWIGMILLSVVVCECCGVGMQYKESEESDDDREVDRY